MKIVRLLTLLVALSAGVLATDYKVDPTFNHTFTQNDIVSEVIKLADGKLLVGGGWCVSFSNNCTPFVVRLNSDGTRDMSLTVALGRPDGSAGGSVMKMYPLANGKYLLTGEFKIGNTLSQMARMNVDGSLDPTLQPAYISSSYGSRIFAPMPDGKMVVCSERTINGQNYNVAHRLNADGTPDTTFRITFMTGGYCRDILALPSGKLLLAVGTFTFEPEVQPLYRINPDGTPDTAFQSPFPIGAYVRGLRLLPDGKIFVSWGNDGYDKPGRRMTQDGAVDLELPYCTGERVLVKPDGTMFASDCRRWQYHYGSPLQFVKVMADGTADQTMDNIRFDENSSGGVKGFLDAGDDRYYVFGGFGAVQSDYTKRKLVRLVPNTTGKRAKYDFDGDGKSDVAVYRPSDGYWYIYQSSGGIKYFPWGFQNDKVAAAHFDTDGKTDIAVFRDGTWHGWSSLINNWRPMNIGGAGDVALPADLEDMGPTLDDFAVRGLRSGAPKWFIREGQYVVHQTHTAYEFTLPGEQAADRPVIGDFSGDSRDEFGYFQDGYWFTADYRGYAPNQTFRWGIAGDIPVPGDYDGDRQDDYAVYRPSTGVWWINRSSGGMYAVKFGISTDIPVPADYDGDGKMDLAIYRDGQWWQYLSSTGTYRVENWGVASDKPIPAQGR